MSDAWPGCHGVHVHGLEAALGFPPIHGEPLAHAWLTSGEVAPAVGRPLWSRQEAVVVGTAEEVVEQRLWCTDAGGYVLRTSRGAALSVDPGGTVVIEAPSPAAVAQLVATYALPLLVQHRDVVLVHAAAAARDGAAMLVAGPSGTGKSSVLVALVDAGWQPISEDICAIDLRAEPASVWPGPPWVRRLRDEPGPRDAELRFDAVDKLAWDISGTQPSGAVPVRAIAVLAPPGAETAITTLARDAAIGALAPHAIWLGRDDEQARVLFPRIAAVTTAAPIVRVTLARSRSWLDGVPELFAGLAAVP